MQEYAKNDENDTLDESFQPSAEVNEDMKRLLEDCARLGARIDEYERQQQELMDLVTRRIK